MSSSRDRSLDPEYFEPKLTPPEVRRYRGHVRQLAAGSSGKTGGLRLQFLRGASGKTVLGGVWKQVPLQVLRPFYYDENQPEMAIVYLLNPTGGTLQGDRLRMDVSLGVGSKVLLTTQAATKIYRMNSDYATQVANIELGPDSYLEYLPDQTIPYRGSRFYQEVNVRMRPGSRFACWEMLTGGRIGREMFEFDVFYSRLSVVDGEGEQLLSDTLVVEPEQRDPTRLGVMAGANVLGNFYLVTDRPNGNLIERVRSSLKAEPTLAGVSPLALTGGLMARVLGPSARVVRGVLEKVWDEVRMELFGSPAPRIRK